MENDKPSITFVRQFLEVNVHIFNAKKAIERLEYCDKLAEAKEHIDLACGILEDMNKSFFGNEN